MFCWEMGGNLGHLAAFREIAVQLADRGHELVLVLQRLDGAQTFFGDLNPRYLQAPTWGPSKRGLAAVAYPDQLLSCGYDRVEDLATLVAAWRTLMERVSPDVLVFDSAPTAMLAARGLGIPRVIHDTTYALPPATLPLPPLGGRLEGDQAHDRYRRAEPFVLERINQALDRLQLPALTALRDLFDGEAAYLQGLPEMDHYPNRPPGSTYVGAAFSTDTGVTLPWPEGRGPRVFCYVRPSSPYFANLLRQLGHLPVRAIVAAPGLSAEAARVACGPNVTVSHETVRLEELRGTSEVAICHAGVGTASAFLLRGVPLILLPNTHEQAVIGRRLETEGLGLIPQGAPEKIPYGPLLLEALGDPEIRDAVKRFAHRYRDFDLRSSRRQIVERIEELGDP